MGRAVTEALGVMSASANRSGEIPSTVIFAFIEDGTLQVFADQAAACREFEGVDVESGSVFFFNAEGVNLVPSFSSPNHKGKFLGLLPWVASGAYKLEPNSKQPSDSLADLFEECSMIEPNPWFGSLQDVARHFQIVAVSPK